MWEESWSKCRPEGAATAWRQHYRLLDMPIDLLNLHEHDSSGKRALLLGVR
jgi:hypothetical protein